MRNLRRIGRRLSALLRIAQDPVAYARSVGVVVGDNCRFLGVRPGTFGSEPYLITIGDHVTLTAGVQFVTHDGGVWVFRESDPELDVFGPISIGSNVFIGLNVLVLPGVSVGNNCVIGAGAVVTKNIPDNSVAVGVPARVVSTLDEYRTRSYENAWFIRSKDSAEKKNILLDAFQRSSHGAGGKGGTYESGKSK